FQIVKGFRCRRGLRILSQYDPAYHPRFGWGLMGGSWPNATAWAAAAIAHHWPDLAWQLAEEIAQSLFPQKGIPTGVSVPGQFPDVQQGYPITTRFGIRARNRFGSIGAQDKKTIIMVNRLFADPCVPTFVVDGTLVHELAHYAHGFGSGLPKLYSDPHRGGVV